MKSSIILLAVLLTLLLNEHLYSADPVLVKNINPNGDANPRVIHTFGDYIIFDANDGTNGIEKWISDGTSNGTHILKDINPNGDGGGGYNGTVFNNEYYFNGNNGSDGYELWKTDGTESGTVMVKDIYPGSNGSYPSLSSKWSTTAIYNNQLIFSATKGRDMDTEPFKTDGTESGTEIISDICTTLWKIGDFKIRGSLPGNYSVVGDYFYFSARNDDYAIDLMYKSDATASGTVLMLDNNQQVIRTGGGGRLDKINDILYFPAFDNGNSNPWRSDGTSSGTYRLASTGSPGGNSPSLFTACGSYIFFSATDGTSGYELWKTDGTESGTVLVKEINPTTDPSIKNNLNQKAVMNDIFYFQGNDGTNGWALWRSDGSESGTYMIKDIDPNSTESGGPRLFTVSGNKLYFVADDGDGVELWESDGTTAGTIKISNINPNGDASIADLTLFNQMLYFSANDGTNGNELWKYDPNQVDDDIAPTAICQDITVDLDASGNATVTASQINNGSYDNDGGSGIASLVISQSTFDCDDIGTNNITLTVTDYNGNNSTCDATVTVQDNTAPTAIGKDITVNLDVNGSVTITADDVDNGSYDNCSFTKSLSQYTFTEVNSYTVTLTIDDGTNTPSTDDVTVTVEAYQSDTEPPTISVSVSPTSLTPVNQQMRTITASVSVSDNNPGVSYVLTSITSNQDDSGLFRKDKANDIQNATYNTADTEFSLRAENYQGDRVYSITYTATDAADNTATAQATVTVPYSPKISLHNDINLQNSIVNIFPNPVDDNLNIQLELPEKNNVDIKVFDLLGIEYFRITETGITSLNEIIDMSEMSPGTYFIQISVANETIQRKIVKE